MQPIIECTAVMCSLRKALHRAYNELVLDRGTGLTFKMFLKLMRAYKPGLGSLTIILVIIPFLVVCICS